MCVAREVWYFADNDHYDVIPADPVTEWPCNVAIMNTGAHIMSHQEYITDGVS